MQARQMETIQQCWIPRGRAGAGAGLTGYPSTYPAAPGSIQAYFCPPPAQQQDQLFQPQLLYVRAGVLYVEGLEAFFCLVEQNWQDP